MQESKIQEAGGGVEGGRAGDKSLLVIDELTTVVIVNVNEE